jgi:acetate kinase
MAFFETSFFCQLPDSERYYALPRDFHAVNGIKKWGFHGLYHQANGLLAQKGEKVVSIVLDKQTTICAMKDGKPYTISLGCTPLEGVMSRTCCGDIDPGIIFYLLKECKLSTFKLDSILKNESGFLGMTGYDLTFGELMMLYGRDKKVTLAFDTYEAQILKYIGESISVLGGVDRVFFSGCYVDVLMQIVYSIVKNISFLGATAKDVPWDRHRKIEEVTMNDSEIKIVINRILLPEIVFHNTLQIGIQHSK